MSKKQFDSRLNSLFADIDKVKAPAQITAESELNAAGWTWECNLQGQYIYCSPDIEKILGMPAESILGASIFNCHLASQSITAVKKVIENDSLPSQVDLYFQSRHGVLVPTRMHVFIRLDENGKPNGWRGFTQVLSHSSVAPVEKELPPSGEIFKLQRHFLNENPGNSIKPEDGLLSTHPWSPSASRSLLSDQPEFQAATGGLSASLAVPFKIQGKTAGLIEVLDERSQRKWSKDDQLLIQEVANQLGLALENAQLFASAQQELSERKRAEEEILSRNRDLSTLNQIGQQLNRLASPSKILELVSAAIGQVMDNSNLFIAQYDENSQHINFPIYILDGESQIVPGRPFEHGFIEYIIRQQVPLLIPNNVKYGLSERGLAALAHMPASLLGVPMMTGEKVIGVIVVQSFVKENAFTNIHADLLSTIATQAAIALENASLFQQMQGALITIEVRERYQKNVARGVAALTESGTQALPEVLKLLGEAAQTSRVYYAQVRQLGHETYWQVTNEWCSDGSPSLLDSWQKVKIPTAECSFLASELELQGRMSGVKGIMPPAEENLLLSWGIRSFLAISVPGKHKVPSFIGFDEISYERPWGTEEIDALQMAASALSNTIIREDLMDQLQASLDESESLYNTSRRLAMATNLQEMVSAITEGLRISDVNRAQVLLFETDPAGQIETLRVAANWYSGWGTQPHTVNTIFTRSAFNNFSKIITPIPLFMDDLRTEPQIASGKQGIIDYAKTASTAIIPLWVGKRQLGVALLLAEVKHQFTDREMRSYPPLIGQLAIAIENLRLFEQTQSALSETEELYQASAELNIARTFDEVLDVLQKYSILGQDSHNLSLCLFDHIWSGDETPGSARVVARKTILTGSNLPTEYILKNFPSTFKMLQSNNPTIIEDVATSNRLDENLRELFLEHLIAKSTIFVPVAVGGHWIGFINAAYQANTSFHETEIHHLMGLVGQAAVAIQNLQSVRTAEDRAEAAMLLFQASRRLSQAHQEIELFRIAREACKQGVEINNLYILLMNNGEGESDLRQAAPSAESFGSLLEDGVYTIPHDYPIADLVLGGQVVVSNAIAQDERLSIKAIEFFKHAGIASTILLPLQIRGQVSGIILAGRQRPQLFTVTETTFIQTITTQLSVALDNNRLIEEAQRSAAQARQRSQELAVINRVVSSVAASSDLRAGLQVVADEIYSSLPLESCGIALLNKERTALTLVADHTSDVSALGALIPLEGNPSTQKVIDTRQTLVIGDAQTNPLTAPIHELMQQRKVQTLIIVPLIIGNEIIGTVGLDITKEGRVLTTEEIHLAETIVYQAASAIQNTRLLEQIQQVLSETELLYKIARFVAQASTPHELLDLVVEYTLPQSAQRASLVNINFDTEGTPFDLEFLGYRDLDDQYQRLGIHLPLQAFPVLQSLFNDPKMIADVNSGDIDPISRDTLEQFNINAVCLVPLRSTGRTIGYLMVSSRQPTTFNPQEIRLLQIAGDGIAVAIEKQHLLQEAQRRALELQTAAEIARDTSSTLALDTLLNRCASSIIDRFGYYHASIYLLNEQGEHAVIQASTGSAGETMKQSGYKFAVDDKSIVGSAARSNQTIIINDVRTSPIFIPEPLLLETQAELAVPLKIGPRVLGVLDVHARAMNAFNTDDVAVLQTLSDQIAVAIDNARSYELIQKAMVELREVDRVKSQFLANMSHELRTPLNSIIGFSKVILKGIDGPINETQQVDLSAIYNSGQHLLRLINDILDLSKIEAGKMELASEDVNLVEQINAVMSTAVGFTKDKPLKLLRQVPATLPVIKADPTRLRQILLNLIGNAAKFTDQGSITLAAEEQIGPDGQPEVIFRVIDTGSGIAPADQGKLFQPFSQVDDSPTRKTGGTGLGLSISRSLVELHQGRIGLEHSEVGKGSTFFFTIPCPPDDRSLPAQDADNANTILAIDDDPQVISLYDRYLAPQGYRVFALTDARIVLETVRKVKPFAITLDILMPNRDGWQVLNELKRYPDTSQIPVIICSILSEKEKGITLGASDYIVKPVLAEDLIRVLTRLKIKQPVTKIFTPKE
jgi:GAF domain-containing protein/ActR/RegA family two-component response regulator